MFERKKSSGAKFAVRLPHLHHLENLRNQEVKAWFRFYLSFTPAQSTVYTKLPLSTINTITTECRNGGCITLEPIPGKRRECYLRFTEKGRKFADFLLSDMHKAEEVALQATLQRYSPEFIEALDFYAKAFQQALNVGADLDE